MTSLWRHSRLTYYDLGPNFLTQGVELLAGEVWQVSKRNSQYFRSYLRKTTGGPFGPPPPAGRGLRLVTVGRRRFLDVLFPYRRISLQSWTYHLLPLPSFAEHLDVKNCKQNVKLNLNTIIHKPDHYPRNSLIHPIETPQLPHSVANLV